MEIEMTVDLRTGVAVVRVPNAAGVDEETARAEMLSLERYLQAEGIPFRYEGKIEKHVHGPEQVVARTHQHL